MGALAVSAVAPASRFQPTYFCQPFQPFAPLLVVHQAGRQPVFSRRSTAVRNCPTNRPSLRAGSAHGRASSSCLPAAIFASSSQGKAFQAPRRLFGLYQASFRFYDKSMKDSCVRAEHTIVRQYRAWSREKGNDRTEPRRQLFLHQLRQPDPRPFGVVIDAGPLVAQARRTPATSSPTSRCR